MHPGPPGVLQPVLKPALTHLEAGWAGAGGERDGILVAIIDEAPGSHTLVVRDQVHTRLQGGGRGGGRVPVCRATWLDGVGGCVAVWAGWLGWAGGWLAGWACAQGRAGSRG